MSVINILVKNVWTVLVLASLSLVSLSPAAIAQNKIDSLVNLLKNSSGTAQIDLLNRIAAEYQSVSIKTSHKYALKALDLAERKNYAAGRMEALENIGFCLYVLNDTQNAQKMFSQSLKMSYELNRPDASASVLNNLGLLHWSKGDFPTAYNYYKRSLNLSRKIIAKNETAKSLNFIGLIYWKWSDYETALSYFQQALKIKEKLGDQNEIAITLNNIAYIYNEINAFRESLKYSNRALEIARETGNNYIVGRALNNLGASYFKLKEFDKSEEIQLRSLKIKTESGDATGMGYSLLDLGKISFERGQYKRALSRFNAGLNLKSRMRDNYLVASLLIAAGRTNVRLGNQDSASKLIEQCIQISESGNHKELLKDAYYALSELYESKSDFYNAHRYLKKYSAVKDSMYNMDFSRKISELQLSFEIDAKEKEIQLLTKEKKIQQLEIEQQRSQNNILYIIIVFGLITALFTFMRFLSFRRTQRLLKEKNAEIALSNAELSQANASKDKFFSIIAHDLKSPFTGLLGYSEIIIEDFDQLSQKDIKYFLENMRSIIKSIFGLIENLLTWSRIQTGHMEFFPQKLDLMTTICSVISSLSGNAVKKNITMYNSINQELLVRADENMVRSVVINLISNAIKFTQTGGGIFIDSEMMNDKFVRISVRDTGVGISAEDVEKLFRIDKQHTTLGTDSEKGTGLGLVLCKELVEKNGGMIWVESEEGNGCTFFFTLPVYHSNIK